MRQQSYKVWWITNLCSELCRTIYCSLSLTAHVSPSPTSHGSPGSTQLCPACFPHGALGARLSLLYSASFNGARLCIRRPSAAPYTL